MKNSLIIVSFFAVGILIGMFFHESSTVIEGNLSFYTLGALMFFVGMNVGQDSKILKKFQNLNPRIVFLPVGTILGTWGGVLVASLLLSHRSIADLLAVASGFGYYSLSSVFITEYRGAELGILALLANIIRELITLLFSPLLVRYFGKLAPIAAGGATTMDTTLPIITRYSGEEFTVVSIFHGFIVDFSVPFLVVLFCSF